MGVMLLCIMIKDGLYCLDSSIQPQAMVDERAPSITWHNHLGHFHFYILQTIIVKYGLTVTHHNSHFTCDSCYISKA